MNRRHVIAILAVAAALLQGCAAPGAPFATLEPVPPGKGNLYLYRKSALYAVAARYKVRAGDGSVVGELYNSSYLLLPLAPGKHTFSVYESDVLQPKTFEVEVQSGRNYFVEYDSSMGLLLSFGLLSYSSPRTEADALADLKGLNRAN